MPPKSSNPNTPQIDEATGKPIRRVTTEWLGQVDPQRYNSYCLNSGNKVGLRGGKTDNAVGRYRVIIATVTAAVRKAGRPLPQSATLCELGIGGTAFRAAMNELESDLEITTIHVPGVRGTKKMIGLKK